MTRLKYILCLLLLAALMVACGSGQTNSNTQNYYSASTSSYYQIESQTANGQTSYLLNVVGQTGSLINNMPLIESGGIYTFSGLSAGSQATGQVVFKQGNLGISVSSTAGSYTDFASQNANSNPIPNGTYTAICDQNNLSPCTMVINNNQISVTEYSISGQVTNLCSNQSVNSFTNTINPNVYVFSCGVQGGSKRGPWYVVPITINTTTGFMINEYDPSINANDDVTDEVAFLQSSINPNGSFNYVYDSVMNSSSSVGISTALFSNNNIINSVIGTCAGAACVLITGKFYNALMVGFDYYSVNGVANYNLTGSDKMKIYQDSYAGIYW